MKSIFTFFALLAGLALARAQPTVSMQSIIEDVKQEFAPDGRVAVFRVEGSSDGVLGGKTNLPAAKEELLARLTQAGITYTDSIQPLPAEVLGDQVFAVVNVSVANIRSQPRHAAELATQALLGMPLSLLDKDGGWYLAQTPDRYIAWADWGGIQRMNRAEFDAWQAAEKVIVVAPYAMSQAEPRAESRPVSDLVAGNRLKLLAKADGFYEVEYPDGRRAYVAERHARPYRAWLSSLTIDESTLVQTARQMMGIPYLWGGTSYKGVDCSGFTKTVYYLHGWVLPRDASQQVHTGELIGTDGGFGALRPGDLLFFGTPAGADAREKVTHVGMWIGNGEFIHASGKVRVSSMDPDAPNYDAFEKNRFLRAKRLLGNAGGVQDLRTAPN